MSNKQDVAEIDGLRFGLIGCGDIGVVRAAALRRSRRHSLAAVSDIDDRKALALANSDAVVDREWRTLIARPELDAVIISTPPAFHEEMVIEALRAGKHVLCEKPLARSPEEARRMVDAATSTGRRLATGFNYRFYPSFRMARRVVESGRIGRLSHIRSYGGYSATSHNQPWVHDAAVVGGGALFDIGIHLIDLTRSFLGEVEEVTGFATNHVWQYPGCEDNGFLLMRGSEGRVATLHASWTEWGRYQFVVELIGERGRIRASCFPMVTEVIWADETGGKTHRETNRFPMTTLGEHARSYRWVVARSFAREHDAFAAAIAGLDSMIASGHDGLRALEIAAAVSGAVSDAPTTARP
jgi:predicted dehydrogenase